MHRTTHQEALPAAGPWPALAKAQAHALKTALDRQGTPVQLGHALELRAHLAGHESWNHYSAALRNGSGFVNDLNASPPAGATVEVALRDVMLAAGAEVLQAALQDAGGGLQLFPVTGTALNFRTLHEQLAAVDEDAALGALFDARPHLSVLTQDPELLLLLGRLCDEEGPGLLARLQAEEGDTWAYLAGATPVTALGFALAHATLPETPEAYDGTPGHLTFGRSRAFAQRLRWPDRTAPVNETPFALPAPGPLERWARLWTASEGLTERLDQLNGRLPAGYPTGRSLPDQTPPLAAHVAFADALERHALQARQAPGQVVDWRSGLTQEALQTLQKSVRREVQAAAADQPNRLPPLAGVEIRAAITGGLTLREVTALVNVLLEDALPIHAPSPAATWAPVRRLRDVKVGDRLRVNRGQPFVVQAVLGVRQFELGVIDHQGLPWDIRDTDDLERLVGTP